MSGPGSNKNWNNAFICIHKQSHNLQLQNSLALPESNVDISNYDKSLLYWWLVEMVLLVALSVTIMSDSLQTSQLCRHQQVWVLGPCINSEGFLQPTLWACNISIKKRCRKILCTEKPIPTIFYDALIQLRYILADSGTKNIWLAPSSVLEDGFIEFFNRKKAKQEQNNDFCLM